MRRRTVFSHFMRNVIFIIFIVIVFFIYNNFLNMYFVYIIQSENYPKQLYTGFTENISIRINDHNEGKSVHTNKFKPWKLIYHCRFNDKKKALDFEAYL